MYHVTCDACGTPVERGPDGGRLEALDPVVWKSFRWVSIVCGTGGNPHRPSDYRDLCRDCELKVLELLDSIRKYLRKPSS